MTPLDILVAVVFLTAFFLAGGLKGRKKDEF